MARLEDLIDQVEDGPLKAALEREIRDLKKRQRFGIVYERHIPEVVALPGLRISQGSTVHFRTEPETGALYRVDSISEDVATVSPINGKTGEPREANTDELCVVKRFEEPVFPSVSLIDQVAKAEGAPFHAVINGENFHVLELLLFLYEGQVDCIYIDPPYNTGSRDWKYNNRYVDENDGWRHSKWLSMMEKRLRLAKRLLKSDGVLICTIDEHEVHHLGMLLESIFPEYLRYMVTIVHNPKGTYKKNFARVDEYAFFCCPPSDRDVINALPDGMFVHASRPEEIEEKLAGGYEDLYLRRRGQESGFRTQRPNSFYAILVDESERRVVGIGPPLGRDDPYEVSRDGDVVTVYPLDSKNQERVWRYARETMQNLIEAGEIVVTGFSKNTGQGWVLNHRKPKRETKRLKTAWWERRHDAGGHGSDLLSEYLGQAALFPFPKSVYAVRDCLDAVVRNRPDALIVDFFAGSGTTFHAACLLNEMDGGHRRSILVTNNEVEETTARSLFSKGVYPGDPEFEKHGIFERVTAPRVRSVIEGKRPDGEEVDGEHTWAGRRPYKEGFSENAALLQLGYLDADDVDLGLKFDELIPLMWLASGATGEMPSPPDTRDVWVPEEAKFAVLFDEGRARELLHILEKRPDVTHIYFVTDSPEAFVEMRSLFGNHHCTMLYRDYIRAFKVTTRLR